MLILTLSWGNLAWLMLMVSQQHWIQMSYYPWPCHPPRRNRKLPCRRFHTLLVSGLWCMPQLLLILTLLLPPTNSANSTLTLDLLTEPHYSVSCITLNKLMITLWLLEGARKPFLLVSQTPTLLAAPTHNIPCLVTCLLLVAVPFPGAPNNKP